jgi:polyisoprenoid-binding protein YceI
MSRPTICSTIVISSVCSALAFSPGPADSASALRLEIGGGVANFTADTNVPAVTIKGRSTAIKGDVSASRTGEELLIEHFQATVPVRSLQSGMGLRDEHMRKYIFTTADGRTPDLVFQADDIKCPIGPQASCTIAGSLTIRGIARPFAIGLKLREEGGAFKVTGNSIIKLSDYGIEQPSQFGVKTENAVAVRVEFSARPAAPRVASRGSR